MREPGCVCGMSCICQWNYGLDIVVCTVVEFSAYRKLPSASRFIAATSYPLRMISGASLLVVASA